MEYLDIRDKNGNPTGVIKERSRSCRWRPAWDFTCMDREKMRRAVMIYYYRREVRIKMPFQDVMTFLPQDICRQDRIILPRH